ncbi:hypothetical protein LRHMDP2_2290 [Lacticaseibacillus rhamnosus LRHMDP2]|uniref:Uncharacterized protein n=1 Tax=Lacticaseibacillus rhamnosus LRHMDP3 TaxID=1203259 RepID=A0AB33XRF6_LACRH|nr:hypothetical protein LRHMDP3_2506 [Lacticaseibacillus rhamnosus LRHMDP3]EKS49686.1 hypothetical protein LRHMDP2_2290 [Lacticaseibacillus rhamnosus LRHMDP2]
MIKSQFQKQSSLAGFNLAKTQKTLPRDDSLFLKFTYLAILIFL